MAGFEFGNSLQPKFLAQNIKSLACFIKGHGAHFRGIYEGLVRHQKLKITTLTQVTSIAHNGTKATRRRRL